MFINRNPAMNFVSYALVFLVVLASLDNAKFGFSYPVY